MDRTSLLWFTIFGLSLILRTTSVSGTSTFECPAVAPCTCVSTSLQCSNTTLVSLPKFRMARITENFFYMYMDSNRFRLIPENAFSNISLSKDTQVVLFLQRNEIGHIETNAFNDIEENIIQISLNNNYLTTIPDELAKLTNLQTLYLINNPVSTINPDTAIALGSRITYLFIGVQNFAHWPRELNYLHSLTDFIIYGLNLQKIGFFTFDGLESNLRAVNIQNSSITRLTDSLCRLQNLESFVFSNSFHVDNGRNLFQPCLKSLKGVTRVSMVSNHFKDMPRVFRVFPNVETLHLYSNDLTYIPYEYIPKSSKLQTFSLFDNNFAKVPSAVRKLASLQNLGLGSNKIKSIDEDDLNGLESLLFLQINDNPIDYIANDAFKNNKQLSLVNIQNTNLLKLPSSLIGLNRLYNLNLKNDPIKCDCSLSYLKSWDVDNVFIDGYCEGSSVFVKTFLVNDLPKCP